MKALRIIPAVLIVITTLFACNKDDEAVINFANRPVKAIRQ